MALKNKIGFCVSFVLTALIVYVILLENYNKPHLSYLLKPTKSMKYSTIYRRNSYLDETKSQTNYRINTKGCKISDSPLFDSQTKDFFFFMNSPETNFKCKRNLINIRRINGTALHIDWSQRSYTVYCYYRQLFRGKDDFTNIYSKYKGPVVEPVLNLPDFEFVHIICMRLRVDTKINFTLKRHLIHSEIIALIPFVNKNSDSSLVPNVLLLFIDSMSYLNFKRHFVRTQQLLNKQKFFELKGYTKVGDNTFPNMVPLLTGYQYSEIASLKQIQNITFDEWPLIWRKFSQKGFVTAFVEEMPKYGLFQYNRKGFKDKPTDYYTRPFQMELEKDTNRVFCYKSKPEFQIALEWTYDFIEAMNERQQKYFAYISISEMTHNWIEAGHYMDIPFYQFFDKLFSRNLLDNTLVIFFSDHGIRTGDFRNTRLGEVENRLPFVFINLPKSSSESHVKNLRNNQYKLSTPYDIHATILHFLQGHANPSLPHGLSLIDDIIDDNRNCEMASIPELFCACYEELPVFDSEVIIPEETIPKIMAKINSITENHRKKCTELQFKAFNAIYERKTSFKFDVFVVQLYVSPGMALFETLVTNNGLNTPFEVFGEITRINRYGNQSHCVNEKSLKNYCFCSDLL